MDFGFKKLVSNLLHVCASFFLLVLVTLNVQAEEEGEAPAQSHYHPLDPAFVTNFGESQVKLKFLKAEISLRVVGMDALNNVTEHNPLIRHEIVMLLSRQTEETLSAPQGQEVIRQEALEKVRGALEEATGAPQVEDLLFTNFVVQR